MNGPTDGVVGGAAAPFLTGFKPVRAAMNRETAAAEIVRQLLQWVGENATESGQRLPSERQLAEIFGVGRSTVREATKALTFLGLIDVRQGAGTYLRSTESGMLPNVIEWGLVLGQAHTLDLVEARKHIEIVVAGLAAERRTDQTLAELAASFGQMRKARDTDVDHYIEADIAFHMKVAEIAGNSVLYDMLTSARSLLNVWIHRVIESRGVTEESFQQHEDILQAISTGDPEAAANAMSIHMETAGGGLLSTLPDHTRPHPTG